MKSMMSSWWAFNLKMDGICVYENEWSLPMTIGWNQSAICSFTSLHFISWKQASEMSRNLLHSPSSSWFSHSRCRRRASVSSIDEWWNGKSFLNHHHINMQISSLSGSLIVSVTETWQLTTVCLSVWVTRHISSLSRMAAGFQGTLTSECILRKKAFKAEVKIANVNC